MESGWEDHCSSRRESTQPRDGAQSVAQVGGAGMISRNWAWAGLRMEPRGARLRKGGRGLGVLRGLSAHTGNPLATELRLSGRVIMAFRSPRVRRSPVLGAARSTAAEAAELPLEGADGELSFPVSSKEISKPVVASYGLQ
ncbi:hypothetical protein CB1_002180002 [Camelus ferus]|nr:hypothetical protein CB1_002180002 [Camelus ferus]